VGALIEDSTWRTSMLLFMRRRAWRAPGRVLERTHSRHQSFICSSSAMLGEKASR
jgi:hypothetical protein